MSKKTLIRNLWVLFVTLMATGGMVLGISILLSMMSQREFLILAIMGCGLLLFILAIWGLVEYFGGDDE